MSDVKIISLYSGSTGNATLIATKSTAILIDAGKSARSLCAAVCAAGFDIDKIDAIFITHEHTDHISALEVLEKKHDIPVHMTEISASNARISRDSRLAQKIICHPPHFEVKVGENMTVRSFCTSHDSAMSVGYRVDIRDGESVYSFGLATDTGCVTDEIRESMLGCRSVLIESNHDLDMLRLGPYPPELKKRILSRRGHLSNPDCAAFAAELAARGTKTFLLGHLSEENNSPSAALETVRSALAGFEGVSVLATKPDCETAVV
jgi:phosphoribosyl 1,2-cyclic phosphodiesterase